MILNFCTLFNSAYLTRGLAMYESLNKHCANFHLYIFAFDDTCYKFLKSNNFKNITVISLREFEDNDLLKVKPERTPAEYCWTSTPSTISYCINTFQLNHCTYIDADIYFYSNPEILIAEMNDASVLITDHRYAPEYDQSKESGKYCVQFICFKNDDNGMKTLKWWRDACIDWCFSRIEDGKFGDQKYLDDWTTRFNGVHELQHLGGGVAPWNAKQYLFDQINGSIKGKEAETKKLFNVVFYHFHSVKFYDDDVVSLSVPVYFLDTNTIAIFYKPYISKLFEWKTKIQDIDNSFNPNGSSGKAQHFPVSLKMRLTTAKSTIKHLFQKKGTRIPKYHYYFNSKDFINS